MCYENTQPNLEVSDERDAVVHSHSADEEVLLDELGVVVGKIYHQVDMAIADQTAQGEKGKNDKHGLTPDAVAVQTTSENTISFTQIAVLFI